MPAGKGGNTGGGIQGGPIYDLTNTPLFVGSGGGRIAVWRVNGYFTGTASVTNGVCLQDPTSPTRSGQVGTLVWGDIIVPKGTVFMIR